ncbi:MAG: lactate utilization protein [Patescibacteria group bacterium]|nr:lactate utilization protein [Patescibacteria group bacterium]
MTYDTLAVADTVEKTATALKERNFLPIIVATKAEALAKIKELTPAGASVMNGSSRTLEEIGFIDYLKSGQHGWNNLHAAVFAEKDPAKQAALRKQSVISDFYLGSVHAVAQTGELFIASASGSQLPHLAYTSPNIILVVGGQKIAPTFEDAFARVRDYVYPLEDARMKSAGAAGSVFAKVLILEREPTFMGRKVHIIFVNEKLGF